MTCFWNLELEVWNWELELVAAGEALAGCKNSAHGRRLRDVRGQNGKEAEDRCVGGCDSESKYRQYRAKEYKSAH